MSKTGETTEAGERTQEEPNLKVKLYRTARTLISCAQFKAGDFVSIEYDGENDNGVRWFIVNGAVSYPEHHLTDFCL